MGRGCRLSLSREHPGSVPPHPRLVFTLIGVFSPIRWLCLSNTPAPTRLLSCRPLQQMLSGPVKLLKDNLDPAAVRAVARQAVLHPTGLPTLWGCPALNELVELDRSQGT